MLILAFDEYMLQALRLGVALDIQVEKVYLHRFPDGESLLRLPTAVPIKIPLKPDSAPTHLAIISIGTRS